VTEHRAGNIREARALFGRAITADPAHVWSYQVSILYRGIVMPLWWRIGQ